MWGINKVHEMNLRLFESQINIIVLQGNTCPITRDISGWPKKQAGNLMQYYGDPTKNTRVASHVNSEQWPFYSRLTAPWVTNSRFLVKNSKNCLNENNEMKEYNHVWDLVHCVIIVVINTTSAVAKRFLNFMYTFSHSFHFPQVKWRRFCFIIYFRAYCFGISAVL